MALETRRRRVCRDPMTFSGMFHCKHIEICCHRSGDFLCGDCDPAIPCADALMQERREDNKFSAP
jgi:hypothetical protein